MGLQRYSKELRHPEGARSSDHTLQQIQKSLERLYILSRLGEPWDARELEYAAEERNIWNTLLRLLL